MSPSKTEKSYDSLHRLLSFSLLHVLYNIDWLFPLQVIMESLHFKPLIPDKQSR